MFVLRAMAGSLLGCAFVVVMTTSDDAARISLYIFLGMVVLAILAFIAAEFVGQMEWSNELREAALQQASSRDITDRELRLAQMHLDLGRSSNMSMIATIVATLLGLLMLKRLLEKK